MELGKGCLTSEVQNKDKAWSHEKGTGNRLGGGESGKGIYICKGLRGKGYDAFREPQQMHAITGLYQDGRGGVQTG